MHSAMYVNCVEKTIRGMVWCTTNCSNDAGTHLLPCVSRERTQSPCSGIRTAWLFPLREPQFAQRKVFDALCSLLLFQNTVIARLFLCFPHLPPLSRLKAMDFVWLYKMGWDVFSSQCFFLVDVMFLFAFCHVHPEHKMYHTTNTICIVEYSWYTNSAKELLLNG